MRFETIFVSREHRYALERDTLTGRPVFSIPVGRSAVEWEEYYEINEAEMAHLLADEEAARTFARECGNGRHDSRLLNRAGPQRGSY